MGRSSLYTHHIPSPLAAWTDALRDGNGHGNEKDDGDELERQEGSSESSDSDIDAVDEHDTFDVTEDAMASWLQQAKDNTRARMAAADKLKTTQGDLEGVDLAAINDEDQLPSIYVQPAVASQVFTDSHRLQKGRQRALTSPSDEAILPGITDKWGELPRRKKTRSQKSAENSTSTGKAWFDMPRREVASLSNDEKREIQALRLSNAMDPKRFMRGEARRDNKKLPEHFQMGYIIESGQGPRAGLAAPSSKLNKQSFLTGLLDDDKGRAWSRRRYAELQEKASSGGKNHYKKKMRDRNSVGAKHKRR